MRMRRSVTALAVAVVGMAAIAFGPGTAYASSGGGCASNGPLEACISASGGNVEPDFYITAPTPGCTELTADIYDMTTNAEVKSWKQYAPCGPIGHFGPFTFAGQNGHSYQIDLTEYGGGEYIVWSPYFVFSN